jgi:hypothetical protein
MSTKKTLAINPELFKINGKTKHKKEKSHKIKTGFNDEDSKNTNRVKKEMLKRVKDYQKNKELEQMKSDKKEDSSNDFENLEFEREFNKSLNFLQDLAKKNKEKHKKKKKQDEDSNIPNIEISMDLPNNLQNKTMKNNEPVYGCLKNGSKPTFNQLNKTQKNNIEEGHKRIKIVLENNDYDDGTNYKENKPDTLIIEPKTDFHESIDNKINIMNDLEIEDLSSSNNNSNNNSNEIFINTESLEKKLPDDLVSTIKSTESNEKTNIPYNSNYSTNDNVTVAKNIPLNNDSYETLNDFNKTYKAKLPKITKITRTKKYKLGKKKDAKHVGILIKNRDTQKNIKQEVSYLKNKSIQEIKSFLREKNLIKAGSDSPNDVLRKLYEDTVLSGELNNSNTNNMAFNYLNN